VKAIVGRGGLHVVRLEFQPLQSLSRRDSDRSHNAPWLTVVHGA